MRRRAVGSIISAALIASSFVFPIDRAGAAAKGADHGGTIKAGYGVADATWHVGAGAGQYASKSPQDPVTGLAGGDVDPHSHSISQKDSYGVQSRLTFRAIVVEDAEGDHVAFVKSDNYLAMDALQRRVGQILAAQGSNVEYDEIMHMASHNHFSPYYTTPSWGVWLFQDAFDIRAFEYQARAMAEAIREAELALEPALMGATEVNHFLFKGMVARREVADDGTPAHYPLDFGDFGLPVIRFDAIDDGEPIAALINWGMHPEGLAADNLITAEFLAPLERFVERATGAPLVMGQGDVGSSESGPARPYELPEGIFRQWDNAGHAQVERGAYLLAQDVIRAWNAIGEGDALVPFDSDFDVAAGNAFIPGPLSHPYPSISNCRTETTVEGGPGVPVAGLPDCERGPFGADRNNMIWENLKAHGVPVPEHYDAPSFTAVEENLRLHLQAFKLGDVILLSCACEAQVDLILNLESRTNETQDDMYLGYDWTTRLDCRQANRPDGTPDPDGDWTCVRKADDPGHNGTLFPGSSTSYTFTDARYDRMLAQIYNDANGWDEPMNAVAANAEPADTKKIWGNFTHTELSAELGYKLPIGVGHAGDYNGYTVSYREYMARDHYRKALTAYGPHTADYMSTTLMELARELNDGDDDDTYDYRPQDEPRAAADEARQVIWTNALGRTAGILYDRWRAALPNDKGPAAATAQPTDIKRFDSTTFSWRGGANAVDNPTVEVQRFVDGNWIDFADQSGEVQTKLQFPKGANGFFNTYAGNQEWIWTANFEAFNAFPAGIGSTPGGEYRFVVDGLIRQSGVDTPYHLESKTFVVSPWDGLKVLDIRLEPDGSVSFTANSTYPELDEGAAFPYVRRHMRGEADRGELRPSEIRQWCDTCSFRPWATSGVVEEVFVTVTRADGTTEQVAAQLADDGRWYAATDLYLGDRAQVESGGARDNYGERNSQASETVTGTEDRPTEGPEQTSLTLTVSGKGSKRVLTATLTELDSGTPIEGRDIKFYVGDNVFLGTARTSGTGVATLNVPPRYRGDSFTFRAVFDGDLAYIGNFATATT